MYPVQCIVIRCDFRVFAPQYYPNSGWGAGGVYINIIGIVDTHDLLTPRPSISIDGCFIPKKEGIQ